jgi:hypothetical protein
VSLTMEQKMTVPGGGWWEREWWGGAGEGVGATVGGQFPGLLMAPSQLVTTPTVSQSFLPGHQLQAVPETLDRRLDETPLQITLTCSAGLVGITANRGTLLEYTTAGGASGREHEVL